MTETPNTEPADQGLTARSGADMIDQLREHVRQIAAVQHTEQVAAFQAQAEADMTSQLLGVVTDTEGESFDPANWVLVCHPDLWEGQTHLVVDLPTSAPVEPSEGPEQVTRTSPGTAPVSLELLHHP